ncbi:response regulator transcription factor [Phormidium tenue]|uniref:response regulator transcription factor n=1 Tax=Phormidium tenue TaxID=126344 RepID=UPI0009FE0072|nr:response regulator [Phormidium tenue]MBD2233134.1 response regulator [Phormidium tenue FACHB-1052]
MKTILIIEDEAQTRHLFLKCLEFEGFCAVGASDGTTGVAMAQQHTPDLVVCDIMMPDMDGYSVLSALRKTRQTALIPLIFLTAKVTMADLRRGMELGADDYLTKPCTVEQFLAAINSRLHRQEQLSELYTDGESRPQEPFPTPPSTHLFPTDPRLANVFCFIEAHYRQPITLNDVAQNAGYSPAYLTNLVQSHTGRTVKQWIIERRMAEAKTLLATTAKSIRQIAEASGYSDAGYFTRQFRQFHGVSPQTWRRISVSELTD